LCHNDLDNMNKNLENEEEKIIEIKNEYDLLAQNLANNLCCKQKIDNSNIKFYSVDNNKINCLEIGTLEINC
jgi:hypothetical protein